jgi:hypothetical protein
MMFVNVLNLLCPILKQTRATTFHHFDTKHIAESSVLHVQILLLIDMKIDNLEIIGICLFALVNFVCLSTISSNW